MQPIYYIGTTVFATAFVLLGWNYDGYLFKTSLLIGGVYFGFLITEALNSQKADSL